MSSEFARFSLSKREKKHTMLISEPRIFFVLCQEDCALLIVLHQQPNSKNTTLFPLGNLEELTHTIRKICDLEVPSHLCLHQTTRHC